MNADIQTIAEATEFTERAFGILQSAVRIARDEQIRTLVRLRQRLNAIFPNEEATIEIALAKWAEYEVAAEPYR